MLNVKNISKLDLNVKRHWIFLQIVLISILLISTILYICPLKYIQIWEHSGAYYNVFQSINGQYQWILIASIVLNILYILYSCFPFVKFRMYNKTIFKFLNFTLFILCIIFIALTFIFAFIYSNNYPKTFWWLEIFILTL